MLADCCANKSPIGVQWSPVDSYRTKGGRVKPYFLERLDYSNLQFLNEIVRLF